MSRRRSQVELDKQRTGQNCNNEDTKLRAKRHVPCGENECLSVRLRKQDTSGYFKMKTDKWMFGTVVTAFLPH